MKSNSLGIARGWPVFTADGKRVGDVTEIHPHYLLVSKGIVMVRDLYLPIGTVDHVQDNRVLLTVTNDTLRGMDLSREPPPLPPVETAPPPQGQTPTYGAATYQPEQTQTDNAVAWSAGWEQPAVDEPYEEQPSYTHPQPNGLVEVEPTVNLAFQDFGYGETLLFIPGWPFDSTIWEPLPTILADERRVVTYDPRGLGLSDRPWDFYSVEMQASDLHRLIVEQSLREVTLVAWSTAALTALLYTRDHPTRVSKLVLLNPLIPLWLADPDLRETLHVGPGLDAGTQELWREELLSDRALQHHRLLDQLVHVPLSAPRREWLWQRLMAGAPHAQVKAWEALRTYDPYLTSYEVTTPLTIVSGAHDRLAPPQLAVHLTAHVPQAQHIVFPDAGHASFMDQREEVIKLLLDLTTISFDYAEAEDTPGEDVLPESEPLDLDSLADREPAAPLSAAE